MNYEEIKDANEKVVAIFEPTIGSIPVDFGNKDYQRYLKWLENPEAEETTPTL